MASKAQIEPYVGRRFTLDKRMHSPTIIHDKIGRRIRRKQLMATLYNPGHTKSQNGVFGHRIDAQLMAYRRDRLKMLIEYGAANSHDRRRFTFEWTRERAEARRTAKRL